MMRLIVLFSFLVLLLTGCGFLTDGSSGPVPPPPALVPPPPPPVSESEMAGLYMPPPASFPTLTPTPAPTPTPSPGFSPDQRVDLVSPSALPPLPVVVPAATLLVVTPAPTTVPAPAPTEMPVPDELPGNELPGDESPGAVLLPSGLGSPAAGTGPAGGPPAPLAVAEDPVTGNAVAEDPVMGGPVLSGTDQLTPDLSWPAYPVPGLGEVVVPPGWPLVLAWDGSPVFRSPDGLAGGNFVEISHPGDVDVWTVLDSLISRDGLQSQPGFQVYSHGSSGDIGYDMAWMAFSVDAEDCLQQVWSYLWISDYRGLLFNAFHCSGPGQVHISDLLEIAARSLPYELPYPLPETTAASTASGSTASAASPGGEETPQP